MTFLTKLSIVQGKPVHEWARYCLEELAAKGASLVALRDFCNNKQIPARRGKYWGNSTWTSLLQPHILLTFAGYGVWNVHEKSGKRRPPEEWLVVPNAHEALISEDTVMAILNSRAEKKAKHTYDKGFGRSRTSQYLLSGGLFTCGRCDNNMIGHNTKDGVWYVCGSQPYRKGKGCGPGVYVPITWAEDLVIDGIRKRAGELASHSKMVKLLNQKLRAIYEESMGYDPNAVAKLRDIERKINNIRQSIEDGLGTDLEYFNRRLAELHAEKKKLVMATVIVSDPPQVKPNLVRAYLDELNITVAGGDKTAQKKLIRLAVGDMKLAPEAQYVEITYRLPEPIMNGVVAGAVYADYQNSLESLLTVVIQLPDSYRNKQPIHRERRRTATKSQT